MELHQIDELNQKISDAISRSVSHTERVSVYVDSAEYAMTTVHEIADLDSADSAEENDGSMDVWGRMNGEDFRLRIYSPAI